MLENINTQEINRLILGLYDKNDEVQWEAVLHLSKIGESAVKPLVKILDITEKKIRENVAIILGAVGDKRATESLILLLVDDYSDVRVNAARAHM